ncbi:MAG: exo-alpha-sialidase, partial [Planctomycetes bacterium]|nr:exo-alpha-sialidase [Planctomycetota bacterium]
LVAIHRPGQHGPAPVSRSVDGGRSWSALEPGDLAIAASKPLCLALSTGQQVLLSNDPAAGRTLLRLAATAPGGGAFTRMWKLRHQAFPRRRLFGGWGDGPVVGHETEWSYPSAVEHDGRLLIAYTQGKEDAALSIVPLFALRA